MNNGQGNTPLTPIEMVPNEVLRDLAKGEPTWGQGAISEGMQSRLAMYLQDIAAELIARRTMMNENGDTPLPKVAGSAEPFLVIPGWGSGESVLDRLESYCQHSIDLQTEQGAVLAEIWRTLTTAPRPSEMSTGATPQNPQMIAREKALVTLELMNAIEPGNRLSQLRNLCVNNAGTWSVPERAETYKPVMFEISLFGITAIADSADDLPNNWMRAATRMLEGSTEPSVAA